MLPPRFLIAMAKLHQPQIMHVAMQFQALTGLRAGMMSKLYPIHLQTLMKLWVAPFKFQQHPTVQDISHLPSTLVPQFLSFKTDADAPLLPFTPEQYKQLFKQIIHAYGLSCSSHSARHLFASLQRFLNVPQCRISQQMIHKTGSSLSSYLHTFPKAEQQVILNHPAYFIPLKLHY